MRKIYLEELPKTWRGIDWINSIGQKVPFEFDGALGILEIVKYNLKTQTVSVNYNNRIKSIHTGSLIKCQLSKILGIFTDEFKITVGTNIKDAKRDMLIVDKEKRNSNRCSYKWYKFKCNLCGWNNGWIEESNLINGKGCSCCSGKTVVDGINDISTTEPWMIKFFQGGNEEAKKYTRSSDKRIYPICPYCKTIKPKSLKISSIYKGQSIGCECSDSISYPEKFMISLLKQLKINYVYQLSKTYFKWCEKYKYDFFLPDYNCIIETHGEQHYNNAFKYDDSGIESVKLNDKFKYNLAKSNKIDRYITINCQYSNKEWITQSILQTDLTNLIKINNVDWNECNRYATSNLVKTICEIKKQNPNYTTYNISQIIGLSRETVNKYLKQGTELGWCDYDPTYESMMSGKITYEKTKEIHEKKVGVYKNDELLGTFDSYTDLQRNSKEMFGTKFLRRYVSDVCNKKLKDYKGYVFRNL